MPLDAREPIAQRLLVLTLALEAALREENFLGAQALFDERAPLLNQLAQFAPSNSATLQHVVKVNKRIEIEMVERSRQIAEQLKVGSRGVKAHKAYNSHRAAQASPGSQA